MSRWTVADDRGHEMTIEIAGHDLVITIDDGPFITKDPEVARSLRRTLGLAVGQLAEDDDPS